jgi:hypothetical protein
MASVPTGDGLGSRRRIDDLRSRRLYPLAILATFSAAFAASAVSAAIQFVNLGTAAPPSTIGGFAMQVFGDDTRPNNQYVSGVAQTNGSPFGEITFSESLLQLAIGNGWLTWSHGYSGDVYYRQGSSVTITLAPETAAFYLYAEPNTFGLFSFVVSSGTTIFSGQAQGNSGAVGLAFYSDDGSALSTITISFESGANGFAIGEFGAARDPCPADTDESGSIDAEDLAAVLFAWGTDGGKTPEADITRDGTVDANDLSAVLGNWGVCP